MRQCQSGPPHDKLVSRKPGAIQKEFWFEADKETVEFLPAIEADKMTRYFYQIWL